MKKDEKLSAFNGIDADILNGSLRNKQIVQMFLQGMTYKKIAQIYGLTASRIDQILNRQARRARYYKKIQYDFEYQALISRYMEMMKRDEVIISSEVEDKDNHISAVHEARLRIALNDMNKRH